MAAYRPRPRRRLVPLLLYVTTACSTFTVYFLMHLGDPRNQVIEIGEACRQAFFYSGALMTILTAHELGHFFQAVRYGVPASLPFFIPMPLSPIGTIGALHLDGGQYPPAKSAVRHWHQRPAGRARAGTGLFIRWLAAFIVD